ncbi:MAG: hypothetical protein PHP53_22405 [Prolixibacteraceae bacterium]|nr:hypothetical protein [Prolixibacteraceae bacterium]
MNHLKFTSLVWTVLICCGGCTSTRYLTDSKSVDRQHDMRANRSGRNVVDVFANIANMFVSGALNTDFEISQSERSFKRITIVNESTDSLFVNMVTDIVWKESGYCDIMGIVLPAGAHQKLLVPYPAAYNVYFRTPFTEEENLEIRTDNKHRRFVLRPGMTNWMKENGN